MSTGPDVPYRLEFSVEVPGTPEQVWEAVATARGMTSWFLPTELEERQGGALHFSMGPEMGPPGGVTGGEPPHRLEYQEDWAALMGRSPDELSPMTSEFLVEAKSGGTCIVRVTTSGFGRGAEWEAEFWDEMGPGWLPFFDNLRLYLRDFAGQEAVQLEASSSFPGHAGQVWSGLRAALGLGDAGTEVHIHEAAGTVERLDERQALIRIATPLPGMLSISTFTEMQGRTTVGVRAYLFSPEAPAYIERERAGWQAWLESLSARG
jgi:uncharacterized protein YndB with AHSA1/START domain